MVVKIIPFFITFHQEIQGDQLIRSSFLPSL
jgi:hypothetical protein